MARPLTVWGSSLGRHRVIVATATKKEAMAAVGATPYSFNQYWTDTGNEAEIAMATAEPGVVFHRYSRGPVVQSWHRGLWWKCDDCGEAMRKWG